MFAAQGRILRGTKDALRRMLQRWDLAASSRSVNLGIEAIPGKPIDFAFREPGIIDGLEGLIKLGARIPTKAGENRTGFGGDFPRVIRAYMIVPNGRIISIPLKLTASAYVSSPDLIRNPAVHAPNLIMIKGELSVRPIAILPETVGFKDASPRCHISEPMVHDRTSKMAAYPHIRSGVDIERLNPQEREGFLREAESLKQIPATQGELVALFRNVPVELISKAHYLEEKKLLLYTLDSGRHLARTRVHDLGIVRDPAAGKNHMVVHRTQFRSVPVA